MRLSEAYTILELPSTATPEEAKKKYRELAKKYHPDVCKDPDAEAKFKKINEAYQIVESGNDTEPSSPMNWGNPFGHGPNYDFSFIFNKGDPFHTNKQRRYATNIDIHTTISFKEAVQGCKKELTYSRQIKCPHCQGSGNKPTNNGCKKCGGRGQVTVKNQNSVFIQTCPECHGKTQTIPCVECKSDGTLKAEVSVHVSVPAFVVDGNTLRLQSIGNFSGTLAGLQDLYTDVHLHIKVIPEPGLRLEDKDVVSNLSISLLDALCGCIRMVTTIDGNKEIHVSKGMKNKEEVILVTGDNNNVKHRIIVNVDYPQNTDKLIDILRAEEN